MDKKNFVILVMSTLIAAFLGAFIASFVIYKMIMPPPPPHLGVPFVMDGVKSPSPKDMNAIFENNKKMLEQQEEFFDRFNDEVEDSLEHYPTGARFVYVNNNSLSTQETPDMYKVTIDLKPFNNDEKNVQVEVKGKTVTISAKYKSNDSDDEKEGKQFSSSQFYQTLTLPSKIDEKSVKKQKEGSYLIITIPKAVKK